VKSVTDVLQQLSERIKNPDKEIKNENNISIKNPNVDKKNKVFFDTSLMDSEDLLFVSQEKIINRKNEMVSFEYKGEAQDGAKTFTFSRGTSYTAIIDICMSLTKMAAIQVKPLTDKQEQGLKSISKEEDRKKARKEITDRVIKKMYKIHTRSANISYNAPLQSFPNVVTSQLPEDPLSNAGFNYKSDIFGAPVIINPVTNDYSKISVYYVTPYRDSSAIDTDNINVKVLSVNEVKNSIKKIYNYNFTGLNDQIIDFDVNFNFAFFYDLPSANAKDRSDGNTTSASNNAEHTGSTGASETQSTSNGFGSTPKTDEEKNNMAKNTSGQNQTINAAYEGTGPRSYFNSLLDNTMNANTSGDLLTVEAKIKGDPFWLGEAMSLSDKTFYKLLLRTETAIDEVSYWDRQAMFVFRLFQSEENTQDSGTVSVTSARTNRTITGLYYVIKVKHTFAGGKFEQQLDARRESRVNVNEINNFIKSRINLSGNIS
jgi:hypothetical protein